MKQAMKHAKDTPCNDCIEFNRSSGVWPIECMQFDHRPGETKVSNVSRFIWQKDLEGMLQEISKCDVVCGNCHAIRTGQRGQRELSVKQKNKLCESMKELQNRPDVRARKSASQSAAMKLFHEKRRARGEIWQGSRRKEKRT